MRNNSKSAMLRMPSLLESRNCLLHLSTSLEGKWIQPKCSSMVTGCFLNPELRHQEGATSWCSARQNWGTERAFHSPQCTEEMSQKKNWRNSRSLPTRSNISWFATQNFLDWGQVHRDGQISTGKPTPIAHRLRSSKDIRKTGISHWTNQAEMHWWNSDQTSEKHLQICAVFTVNLEKSDLNQFLFINTKGGIRRLLHPVPHGGSGMNTGGAHKLKNVNYLWAHGMSSIKEQGDLFLTLTHQDTQSGIFDDSFWKKICCSHIGYSW